MVAYAELIETTVQVVLAAHDECGIDDAAVLGIVPFGSGVIRLTRPTDDSAQILTHLSNGSVERHTASVSNGQLELEVSEVSGDEAVEWIQVVFEQ